MRILGRPGTWADGAVLVIVSTIPDRFTGTATLSDMAGGFVGRSEARQDSRMDGTARRVAAFDFDGTVSRRDTLIPFVARFAGVPRSAVGSLMAGWDGLRGGGRGLRDRDALKARMVRRLLSGRDARELERAAGVYAARLIDSGLRPEMVEEVRRHVAAGHRTLFVSASLEDYLLPIARYLGMSGVIAVELERRDGRLTGRLAAPNVRAEQKAVRLREHLGAPSSGPLEGIELWAYGNSSGDHALLEMADHALWLGAPEKRPPGVEQYGPTTAFGTSSSGR